jgi:DNA mismatch repair protein MutS2
MDSHKQLEFDKLKKILANLCHTVSGKRFAQSLTPLKEPAQIRYRHQVVAEIQGVILCCCDYEFHDVTDIKPLFFNYQHLTYSYPEFKKIYKIIQKAGELSNDLNNDEVSFTNYPEYTKIVKKLAFFPLLAKRYESIFSDEGEVLDTASPELKEIRKRQFRVRQNVLNLLTKRIQDKTLEKAIQDKIITQRDDRYVIPIKEGAIGTVPGIIHGYSGSRSTIFVEPNEAVGMNNEIHQLRQEEKEEIYRIFRDFTTLIQSNRNEILEDYSILCELDYYFAAARLGNLIEGTIPLIASNTVIKLKEARHPLLLHAMQDRQKVIPFDLSLGEEYDILILSGPNTGGKTVTLKAIGLLTLMALSGLTIPAASGSEIGLFHDILADIGDQQSLEDSLSTFSAHLQHIKQMLETGNDKTLILIDEIGSATDPEQGAALAQAITETLVDKKVTGVITTHFTPLKLFALKSERCKNAAMQFDPEQHLPTYRFRPGLPGNSFALEIAEGLGLQETVLQRAKELTGKTNVELTDLLARISSEKNELAQTKFHYELKLNLLNQKINEYDKKLSLMEQEKKNTRQELLKDSREFLVNIQREFGNELAKLKELERDERKKAAKQVLKKVSTLNSQLGQEEMDLRVKDLIPVTEPKIGEIVWIRDLDGIGEISAVEKNSVKVDFNGILFVTNIDNLYYQKSVKRDYITRDRKEVLSSNQAKTEIKVIGMTFEDALPLVETFLDEGYLAGLNKLRIVHGKGTGALRNKIRKYLKGVEKVKEFYSPAPEAGGDGVTVVVIR